MGTIEEMNDYVGSHITLATFEAQRRGWVFNPLDFEEDKDTLKVWMKPQHLETCAESDELVFTCKKQEGVWIVTSCIRDTNYKK